MPSYETSLILKQLEEIKKENNELKQELITIKETQDQVKNVLIQMGKVFEDIINKVEAKIKNGAIH